MSETPKKRGGQPGNKGGRPKSQRPISKTTVPFKPYEDCEEWIRERGGIDYIRRLIDLDKANPVPLYPPEDLIA